MKEILNNIPPHSVGSEKAILSSMILDNSLIIPISRDLEGEDFYVNAHQNLFDIIVKLYRRDTIVDLVTISEYVMTSKLRDKIGGYTYLSDITRELASTANYKYYVNVVKDKSDRRKLIHGILEITEDIYNNPDLSIRDLCISLDKIALHLMERKITKKLQHLSEFSDDSLNHLADISEGKIVGVQLGFGSIDEILPRLEPNEVSVVAARPSVGKTAFMINVALNVAKSGYNVAIFSLEMGKKIIYQRMLYSEAMVDGRRAKAGKLEFNDFERMLKSQKVLDELEIYVDDDTRITPEILKFKIQQLNVELLNKGMEPVHLVVIDYLQLMTSDMKYKNKYETVTANSNEIRLLSGELNTHIMLLSQLNRDGTGKPKMSNLRDSGAIEQDATNIMFLHRDDYEKDGDSIDCISDLEIIIGKQRNGPTGSGKIKYDRKHQKFEDSTDTVYGG